MTNHCIGCKRELAPNQKDCHICGAPQSFIRFYFKSGLLFVVAMSLITLYGIWYVDQLKLESAAQQKAIILEVESKLKAENAKLVLELAQVQKELEENKALGSQADEAAALEKAKLAELEEQAKKAESRASWLSRENRRFKAQISDLESKVTALEQQLDVALKQQPTQAVESLPQVQSPDNNVQSSNAQNQTASESDSN